MKILLILALLWPAVAGAMVWLLPAAKEPVTRGRMVVGALILEMAAVILACFGNGTDFVLLQMTPTLAVHLHLDTIGCIFSVLMTAMWLLGGVFALDYLKGSEHEHSYQAFYLCVLTAMVGQCYAGSMITLYIFYELMTMLSVPMVVHERTPEAVAAGVKYLIYSIFGAMMGLLGIFFYNNMLGTVTFVPGGAAAEASPALLVITFLVILGFGTKAGMFPLHGWLPTAHPVAPAPASAVLSGVITKAGVLAIIRVIYFLVGAKVIAGTWVQFTFMTLTLITVFMGSMLAYREPLLKKRLAFSTVSQVSYVLFGLSCLYPESFTGGILHVVAHSVIKDCLFLCAGAMIHETGKTYVTDLRGIGKRMPVTTWCWTIASMGLIGIPPTSGFVSKWALATGSLAGAPAGFSIAGPIILIISALLTAAYLLPVTIYGFFPGGDFDYEANPVCEGGWHMTVPMMILAALVVLTGIFSSAISSAVAGICASVL